MQKKERDYFLLLIYPASIFAMIRFVFMSFIAKYYRRFEIDELWFLTLNCLQLQRTKSGEEPKTNPSNFNLLSGLETKHAISTHQTSNFSLSLKQIVFYLRHKNKMKCIFSWCWGRPLWSQGMLSLSIYNLFSSSLSVRSSVQSGLIWFLVLRDLALWSHLATQKRKLSRPQFQLGRLRLRTPESPEPELVWDSASVPGPCCQQSQLNQNKNEKNALTLK